VASMDTAETVMDGGDTAVMDGGDTGVKSAAVKTTGVEPAAVEPAMEPTAVESATVPSTSASLGEIWLADDSRAQQRSCNAHHSSSLPGGGFVIA
jgi:hypothetical protein